MIQVFSGIIDMIQHYCPHCDTLYDPSVEDCECEYPNLEQMQKIEESK